MNPKGWLKFVFNSRFVFAANVDELFPLSLFSEAETGSRYYFFFAKRKSYFFFNVFFLMMSFDLYLTSWFAKIFFYPGTFYLKYLRILD